MPDTPDDLDRMLTRLKLTAIRDQIDSLIDEADPLELTIHEALTPFCGREIARKDQRTEGSEHKNGVTSIVIAKATEPVPRSA